MVAPSPHVDLPFAPPSGLAALLAGDADAPALAPLPLPPEFQASNAAPSGVPHQTGSTAEWRATIHDALVAEHQPVGALEESLIGQLGDLISMEHQYTAAREAAIRCGMAMFQGIFGAATRQEAQARQPMAGTGDGATLAGPIEEHGARHLSVRVPDEVIVSTMTSPPVLRLERLIECTRKQVLQLSTQLEKVQDRRRIRGLPRLAATVGITIDLAGLPKAAPSVDRDQRRLPDPGCTAAGDNGLGDGAAAPAAAPPLGPSSETPHAELHDESCGSWTTAETEADCERIFRAWVRGAGLACPNCGSRKEALELPGRRVLQCRCCGGQRGLRQGTFLAHSNISFLAVNRAVRLLAHDPQTSLMMLRHATGLSRRSISAFRSRILEALGDTAHRLNLLAACGWRQEPIRRQ